VANDHYNDASTKDHATCTAPIHHDDDHAACMCRSHNVLDRVQNLTRASGRRRASPQKCVDMDPYDCGYCLYKNWGRRKALDSAGCPGANVSLGRDPYKNWDFQTIGFCVCGPLDAKSKDCPAKISGVCNAYHANVTITDGYGRSRGGCTAPPGGVCELGDDNTGEQIGSCNAVPSVCMSKGRSPEVVSSDKKLDLKFWVNLSAYTVTGMERHGGNFTNFTDFAHACGYKNQWSLVIDQNAKVAFYPNSWGMKCPNGLLDAQRGKGLVDVSIMQV